MLYEVITMETGVDPLLTNNHWTKDNDSLLPEPNYTPKGGKGGSRNTKGQTLDKILNDYGLDSIPLTKTGDVNWSALSVIDPVNISMKNLDINIDKFLSDNMSSKDFV